MEQARLTGDSLGFSGGFQPGLVDFSHCLNVLSIG
jgi:hypothetical protein